jgi:hypothetical protein
VSAAVVRKPLHDTAPLFLSVVRHCCCRCCCCVSLECVLMQINVIFSVVCGGERVLSASEQQVAALKGIFSIFHSISCNFLLLSPRPTRSERVFCSLASWGWDGCLGLGVLERIMRKKKCGSKLKNNWLCERSPSRKKKVSE